MTEREYLDPIERMELHADEELVCDLLGEYTARRDQSRLVLASDLLEEASAFSQRALVALSTAIAFYEHALKLN